MKKQFFILIAILFLPLVAGAHPGNTDSSGCHTCRTNCPKWGLSTGEYHCHNAKALPQPEEPIRSHYNESGGTTEPWPAYKNTSPTLPQTVSAPKNSTTATFITYSLSKGMMNDQVKKLQEILARDPGMYPEGLVTGYFGPATERAVKLFQKKHGLEQVGYIGPKTRALLNSQ